MPLLLWILIACFAMAAIALIGSVTLVLSEPRLKRLLLPLVALAAGSLLGGAQLQAGSGHPRPARCQPGRFAIPAHGCQSRNG